MFWIVFKKHSKIYCLSNARLFKILIFVCKQINLYL